MTISVEIKNLDTQHNLRVSRLRPGAAGSWVMEHPGTLVKSGESSIFYVWSAQHLNIEEE